MKVALTEVNPAVGQRQIKARTAKLQTPDHEQVRNQRQAPDPSPQQARIR